MNNELTQCELGGLSLWSRGLLPMAHLLDGTWWFDSQTVKFFRRELSLLPDATIAFLGTPSLFLNMSQCVAFKRTLLFDKDEAIRECLPAGLQSRFWSCDLRRQRPDRAHADLVIADPPWYVEEMMSFLAAGQAVARRGGHIHLCIPPVGIRPGIEEERRRLFSWAADGGLRLETLSEGKVQYEAPPFERSILRSTGQEAQQQTRNGDLAIFRVESLEGLEAIEPPCAPRWEDAMLLQTRWRVRIGHSESQGAVELLPLGFHDNVFPSCSRRHPSRDQPDIWTSGNRAFRCDHPHGFLKILRSLQGNTVGELLECAATLYPIKGTDKANAVAQILALASVEQREVEALRRCLNGRGT